MPSRPQYSGDLHQHAPIPPIEIGSFVALEADKSEFIGSASGVFFVNTVFRSFATSSSTIAPTSFPPAAASSEDPPSVAPDPGSAHSYIVPNEPSSHDHANQPDAAAQAATPTVNRPVSSEKPLYGVRIPGIGLPPTGKVAKRLAMLYFRWWHPFFPFLHGPTFFGQVTQLYERASTARPHESAGNTDTHKLLCRAVTFQCIFNLAAATDRDAKDVDAAMKIKSTQDLTNLLGTISANHDIASLQAMLAMELYLVSNMALRAASVVHGTLSRMLYHAGFHRCPFRYVQLPQESCGIRQRIFWCAYVLDRHLSQSLGHPHALRDDEIDVCIPGLQELHNPVRPLRQSSPSNTSPSDEVLRHLPNTSADRDVGNVDADAEHESTATPGGNPHTPSHHHMRPSEEIGEFILGYLATHARLMGGAYGLFHQSIDRRAISWDKVLDLTSRVHSWWNSLPEIIQGNPDSPGASESAPYASFFTMMYHYLILIINRPFLSLPTHRHDFQSSLQSALGASRAMISKLSSHRGDRVLTAWPGTLSATWMAGLVVAFAGKLRLYPPEKAVSDVNRCLVLLTSMSHWSSAGHCHATLKFMVDRLTYRPAREPASPPQPIALQIVEEELQLNSGGKDSPADQLKRTNETTRTKRRRRNDDSVAYPLNQGQNTDFPMYPVPDQMDVQNWQPVLEYTGPDFGFDANPLDHHEAWQNFIDQGMGSELTGLLYGDAEWDAYVKTFGDRINYQP